MRVWFIFPTTIAVFSGPRIVPEKALLRYMDYGNSVHTYTHPTNNAILVAKNN